MKYRIQRKKCFIIRNIIVSDEAWARLRYDWSSIKSITINIQSRDEWLDVALWLRRKRENVCISLQRPDDGKEIVFRVSDIEVTGETGPKTYNAKIKIWIDTRCEVELV